MKSVSTLCHGEWAQLQPAETSESSTSVLDPFIPSSVVNFEEHGDPYMGTLNDADENKKQNRGWGITVS